MRQNTMKLDSNAVREGIENPQMTLEELNIKFK